MKTATKFWLVILGLLFIGLQFDVNFRESTLLILSLGFVFYFWFCVVYLVFYFIDYEKEDLLIHKLSILYWIICLPISKFNNWLNSL